MACSSNCQSCTKFGGCDKCENQFFRNSIDATCIANCPDGYYGNIDKGSC